MFSYLDFRVVIGILVAVIVVLGGLILVTGWIDRRRGVDEDESQA